MITQTEDGKPVVVAIVLEGVFQNTIGPQNGFKDQRIESYPIEIVKLPVFLSKSFRE